MAAKSPGAETEHTELEHEDTRDMLRLAAVALERWRDRLLALEGQLPAGRFAPDTDEPRDLPAAWRGLLEATRRDELEPAIEALRRAAEWTRDPSSWRPG